ncbi:MAG: hypothetical protein ACK5XN_25440, partial [Bacteroidota bacterium]
MGKIPIKIDKINIVTPNGFIETSKRINYLITIHEKGRIWEKSMICDRIDLIRFRDEINKIIDSTTTAEVLNLTEEKAKIVDRHYIEDILCKDCAFKLTYR